MIDALLDVVLLWNVTRHCERCAIVPRVLVEWCAWRLCVRCLWRRLLTRCRERA